MESTLNNELIDFLNRAHNEYLATYEIKNVLLENDFEEVKENEVWNLKPNSKYFLTRNDNSCIAFITPSKVRKNQLFFKIISSHLDSPSLKLKSNSIILDSSSNLEKHRIEVYGGLIRQSFVDRPLGLAGRVVVKTNNGIESRIFDSCKAIAIIPNVAIHQNREINDGFKYNPHVDLLPIVGGAETIEPLLDSYIKDKFKDVGEVLSYDLYFYNFDKAQYIGINDDFISGAKEDDLANAFLSLKALLETSRKEDDPSILVSAFFNNEETGSLSFSGADSDLLENTLKRIGLSFDLNEEEYLISLKKSFALSADNGHAVHPYHPELSDDINKCQLNKGPMIKFNSNMAYTSDALTSSFVISLCKKCGVKYQVFHNRSDQRGGSTLGNISISHVSILTCDIGLPQLAMHSSFETMGSEDTSMMLKLMSAFYQTNFRVDNGVIYI